ncbi:methyltransferase N6AMT1 [Schistocerca cancellata]|uniref:methyltransferase N6AMT1 n=1 Tax=Schistocerca cancellata TaxID=274614 RepID=UPI0021186E01|nr:methyltransferase N6AMT1 [Schistocerca cancellata]
MSKYEFKIITPSLSHMSSCDFDAVYEPAEDTFLLIDALEDDLQLISTLKPSVCLEVGSGSGAVITAISMFLGNSCHCMATDISFVACKATQKTSLYNSANVDTINTDLVSAVVLRGVVDILIFNPPYVVTPSEEISSCGRSDDITRSWAGGLKGREVMDRIFSQVPLLLSETGVFYLLVISDNCPSEIEKIMNSVGFSMNILMQRKIRGEHLLVLRFRRAAA